MKTILVSGFSSNVSSSILEKIFSKYGEITSISIKKNRKKFLKNIAFINFKENFKTENICDKIFKGTINGNEVRVKQIKKKSNQNQVNSENMDKILLKKKINKKETRLPEGSLMVINFPTSINHNQMQYLFGYFGYVTSLYIKEDNSYFKKSKTVFVRYGIPECAIKAACFIEKKFYMGNIIQVKNFNLIKNEKIWHGDSRFKIFKRFQYRKKTDVSSYDSWVSLFTGGTNVMDNLEHKYGKNRAIKKKINSTIFHKNQISVSQGRINAESRILLKNEGINSDFFPYLNLSKKSRRCFFLKYKFYEENLFNFSIFKKFGKIKNFYSIVKLKLLIIEYKNRINAKLAFENLEDVLAKEKSGLMDWVPLDFIKNKKARKYYNPFEKETKSNYINNRILEILIPDSIHKIKNVEILSKKFNFEGNFEHKSIKMNTIKSLIKKNDFKHEGKLIVRNIPFKTKLYNLREMFSIFGKILSIRLPKKKNGENKGYAFIIFKNLNDAKKALFLTQGTQLSSRNLKVSLLK
jgi:RNA recognition motif-containing protein